jgi:hypothetical protein
MKMKIPTLKTIEWSFSPVISADHPDCHDIRAGFEGGFCLRQDGLYHLFPTERIGRTASDKTRLGYWTSPDGLTWKRESTLVAGTGDETGSDPDAVVWQATPVFDEQDDRWLLFYVAYHFERKPAVGYHHRKGRILMRRSSTPGRSGLGGPYIDPQVILAPEDGAQAWEGDQGVDSFFPYPAGGRWLGLYGSARTETLPKVACSFWGVGVAEAPSLRGPWTRCPAGNPLDLRFGDQNQYPCMPENPLVYRLADGLFLGVMDYVHGTWGSETGFVPVNPHIPEDNQIPYIYSHDGKNWKLGGFLEFEPREEKWWNEMRTPLSFIHEGGNRYTIFFTAYRDYRGFAPLGRASVELNITET